MIEIIKEPPKKYKADCEFCGCSFSYELSDIELLDRIICPSCGHSCHHEGEAYADYDERAIVNCCNHVWKGYANQDPISGRISYHRRCQNCGMVEVYEDTVTNTTARME